MTGRLGAWRGADGQQLRLFVAVWVPHEVRVQLAELVAGLRRKHEGVHWTQPEGYHVTLAFLGKVMADQREVGQALDDLDLSPATTTIGPELRMFGRSVLYAPVQGLDEIAATMQEAMAPFTEKPDDHPFTGHVTLARLPGGRTGRRRRSSVGFVQEWLGTPVSAEWSTDAISIVHSERTRSGTVYHEIHHRSIYPGGYRGKWFDSL